MRGRHFWIGIFPFFLAFLVSLQIANVFSFEESLEDLRVKVSPIEEFSPNLTDSNFYIPESKNCISANSKLKFQYLKYENKQNKKIQNSGDLINNLTHLNIRKDELNKKLLKNNLSEGSKNEVVKELIEIEIEIKELMNFEFPTNETLLYLEKCFEK